MIFKLTVENFYSIADELSLDFRVPQNTPGDRRYLEARSNSSERLPAVVVMFGPNASGKSTILRAITATVAFARDSFDQPVDALISDFQCFLGEEWIRKPIRVSIEFDALWLATSEQDAPQLFKYELSLGTDEEDWSPMPNIVLREALYHYPKGKRRRLFERNRDKIYVAKEFNLAFKDPRLNTVRPNCSVISTLAKLNNELATRIWIDLSGLQSNLWGLTRQEINNEAVIKFYQNNSGAIELLNRELERFDVGIEKMELKELGDRMSAWFYHHDLVAPVFFDEESSGTRHFVKMFPVLGYVLSSGHVAVFDEFDADLHPDLVKELFEWFYSKERNPRGAQLIITAHNAALFDILEKEQIVLVEKRNGRTQATLARHFRGLRRQVSLYNKYMGGSLGARPRIG